MFSPPSLRSRPAPSPRSAQATRLVTSNAASTLPEAGFTEAWMHFTSASLLFTSESQLPTGPPPPPPPPGGGGGGGAAAGVRNAWTTLHGPVVSESAARTRQKNVVPAVIGATGNLVCPAPSFTIPAVASFVNA